MRSFYNVLDCNEDVSDADLKVAYHNLLRQSHPDKVANSEVGLLNLVRVAYQTLRDKNSRLAYDNWLREQLLRENSQRVDQTIRLQAKEALQEVEEYCRCGATFEISVEELSRVLDYALFECENCSLCLKVIKNEYQ